RSASPCAILGFWNPIIDLLRFRKASLQIELTIMRAPLTAAGAEALRRLCVLCACGGGGGLGQASFRPRCVFSYPSFSPRRKGEKAKRRKDDDSLHAPRAGHILPTIPIIFDLMSRCGSHVL